MLVPLAGLDNLLVLAKAKLGGTLFIYSALLSSNTRGGDGEGVLVKFQEAERKAGLD